MNQISIKAVHLCIFPETKLEFIEKCIRTSAMCGYSHIVLEFWGTLKYDCLKELGWDNAYSKKEIKSLAETARTLGLEVIPMFNHLGHASQCREIHGKHVVLDQNPNLSHLFKSHGWEWDIENDEALCLLRKIRRELIELCGEGQYFHLGCDEAYSFGQREDMPKILCDYLNGIQAELTKVGRRAVVWGDMLLAKSDFENEKYCYIAALKSKEQSCAILERLDKNIVIADWQYNVLSGDWKSSILLKDAGFDALCCPWHDIENASSAVKCANGNNLFGVMHTTWHTLNTGFPTMVYTGLAINNRDTGMNYSSETIDTREIRFIAAEIARKAMPAEGRYKDSGWTELDT